jgi:glutamate dehydrogenase (NAD(P)+)
MAWMMDTYQTLFGQNDINARGVCTGKPIALGGIDGRNEATGLGVYYSVKYLLGYEPFLKRYNMTAGLKDKTVIVHGTGNCGKFAAKFCQKDGAKIIGLAGSIGGVYNPDGFKDVEDAIKYYYANKKSFKGYPDGKEFFEGDKAIEVTYK